MTVKVGLTQPPSTLRGVWVHQNRFTTLQNKVIYCESQFQDQAVARRSLTYSVTSGIYLVSSLHLYGVMITLSFVSKHFILISLLDPPREIL